MLTMELLLRHSRRRANGLLRPPRCIRFESTSRAPRRTNEDGAPKKPAQVSLLARTPWQERLAKLDALFITGVSRFHEITGYNEIEKIKKELVTLEDDVKGARDLVKRTRDLYNENLALRANSQKEMNELLMRKQMWQAADLERFTELYKDDHLIQAGVEESKQRYDKAETQLEDLQLRVGTLIGARYREEQLWSDKIRQASTWGTWVLMGINIVLFIVVQLILEPWKRRRLVKSFEGKVDEVISRRLGATMPAASPDPGAEQSPSAAEDADLQGSGETRAGNSTAYSWSTLWYRLQQPSIVLRPVEAASLTLCGVVVACASLLVLGTHT